MGIKTKSSKIKRKKENYKIPSDKETTIISNETPKNKRPISLTYLLNKTPVPDDVPNRSSSRDMTETKLPKWLKVFESNKDFDGMKELEEDAKREPDERLPRVRDHIVERYKIEHEDDDYTSHNKLIAPGNEPETVEDVPMEVDIIKKKEVKKSKKRKKDSVNEQEEIPKKQEKQKKKKKKDNKENSIDKPEPKTPKTVEFNEKIEYKVNEEENFYNDESSCEDANVDDDVYNTEIEESDLDEDYQIDESKKKKQNKRQSGESHVKQKTSKLKEKQRSMDGVPPKKKKKKKIESDE